MGKVRESHSSKPITHNKYNSSNQDQTRVWAPTESYERNIPLIGSSEMIKVEELYRPKTSHLEELFFKS